MKLKGISLSRDNMNVIKREFNIPWQTAYNALTFFSNSDQAKAIRQRALQLLQADQTKLQSQIKELEAIEKANAQ